MHWVLQKRFPAAVAGRSCLLLVTWVLHRLLVLCYSRAVAGAAAAAAVARQHEQLAE
jgi:hypothetical protein